MIPIPKGHLDDRDIWYRDIPWLLSVLPTTKVVQSVHADTGLRVV